MSIITFLLQNQAFCVVHFCVVSFLPRLSLVLRTIIVVVLDIPVFDVASESTSVAMETYRYDNLDFWLVWMRLLLASITQIQSGLICPDFII